MKNQFLLISFIVFAAVEIGGYFKPSILFLNVIIVPLFLIGIRDLSQKKRGVKRNFPVIGNLRYLFEAIRPELQQYFVESNLSGRPISREFRSVVYQRAKGQRQTTAFGTQRDVEEENHEWVNHSMVPKKVALDDVRVLIGGDKCKQPYSASILNISAMSYGALGRNAISSLNLGAKQGGFYHNTGEGGISEFHKLGGDLVWQLGTAYFGCRDEEGKFCPEKFEEKSNLSQVKMIEIKLSQGAKPGKGGMLPGSKVSAEIAKIRGVKIGETVISPSGHSVFSNPVELLHFVGKLRDLSGGKPIGIKLCVGKKIEFVSLCKAMIKENIYPDYIAVDGAQGGTGAAPLEFANSVGTPLNEGLSFVDDCLKGYGIREKVKIIASGKILTSFHILTKIALGADLVASSRAMMLSLGCIHALACNTNKCPAGVATMDEGLQRGLYIPDKSERVARFHKETVHSFAEILGAIGLSSPDMVCRRNVYRRTSGDAVKTYEEIFPTMPKGSYLDDAFVETLPVSIKAAVKTATHDSFNSLLENV